MTEDIRLFEEAKSSLLRYYSELQSSQATRLIGFAVALFTLVQTVQSAHQNGLSVIFRIELNIPTPNTVGLVLFSGGIFVLVLLIVRTIFRYAALACFVERVTELQPNHVEEGRSFQTDVHYRVSDEFSKDRPKLYFGLFPATWFIRTGAESSKRETTIGLIVTVAISLVLAFFLLWLLW